MFLFTLEIHTENFENEDEGIPCWQRTLNSLWEKKHLLINEITSRNEVISEILKWSLYLHKQFLSQLCFGEEKKRYIPSKSLQRIKPKKLSSTK